MGRHNNGYWRSKRDGKYNVRIYENGVRKFLGSYDTELEAMEVYSKECENKLIRSVEQYDHCLDDGVVYKDNYVVFDNGDIFSISGCKIKPSINIHGYLHCRINNIDETVHRIVANCFIPNRYNHPCINHINGIKTDNRVINLEWCTYSENLTHAYQHELRRGPYGETNGMSKLSPDDVKYIRSNYIARNPDYNMNALAVKFGVHKNTIYDIIHNKKWSHI